MVAPYALPEWLLDKLPPRPEPWYKRTEEGREWKRQYDRRKLKGRAPSRVQPKWADTAAIAAVYVKAARKTAKTGRRYVVDHIIPLNHPLVCGLHVHNNLRAVLESTNRKKASKFDVV